MYLQMLQIHSQTSAAPYYDEWWWRREWLWRHIHSPPEVARKHPHSDQRPDLLTSLSVDKIYVFCQWVTSIRASGWAFLFYVWQEFDYLLEIKCTWAQTELQWLCPIFGSPLIMMTSWNGNIFRVTGPLCGEFTGPGEFPAQRPVTRSFDVFFDLRPNKRLSKQPWGWCFCNAF